MQEEPNKLIRALLDPKRTPTAQELQTILGHVARARFASRYVRVDSPIREVVFQGHALRKSEPSIIAHLAKRVLVEEQWAMDVTPDEYLAHLRSAVNDPQAAKAVYIGSDGRLYFSLLATNRLPRERLGKKAEAFLWVVYAADYGTRVTGYQVPRIEAVRLPKDVRWL